MIIGVMESVVLAMNQERYSEQILVNIYARSNILVSIKKEKERWEGAGK